MMKNVLKITLVLVIALLCSTSFVKAATTDELVAYASKTFTIAGEEVKLSDSDLLKVKRYLQENPVSEENGDKIIAKVDEAVALMNAEGVSDPTKLSQEKKEELLAIAQEAASLAGATISYDATNKVITIYKDGEIYDTASLKPYFVQTGSNNTMYVIIAAVAIIAVVTALGYRKMKTNA